MIFQHTWQAVMDGTKTQTRRIVNRDDHACVYGPDAWYAPPDYADEVVTVNGRRWVKTGNARRSKWRVGDTYAVQSGRGKSAVGRIRITQIRREDVRQISDADVKAEGFDSRADFLRLWEQMHGSYYDAWALTFERVA